MTAAKFTWLAGWTALLLLCAADRTLAQSRGKSKTQLQKEKQQNLQKIRETEKILTETANQKRTSLGELSALNQRIQQQETLIVSIRSEIELLDLDIAENNSILDALSADLTKLKEEYAAMIFAAQKTQGGISKLSFLFSATSFNQFLMRKKYLEQYSTARQEQAAAIAAVQKQLNEQVRQTEIIKEKKRGLLTDEESEKNNLNGLKKKQRTVVRSLEREESRLRRDLEDTRVAVARLDKLINEIIREEMERAAREAREKEAREKEARERAEKNANKSESTARSKSTATNAATLSASFEDNRAKFAWPVSGFVSQKFGRQNHPVLKGIVLQNDGINIQTQAGEMVHAIFEGTVGRVAFIPILGNTVIINHGDYFTVYVGLKDVSVKQGQKVVTHQEIGQVQVNAEGISELRFQIRKNTQALDPQDWLRN